MDEQLKKILVQFLQLMLDGIEKGAKFAGEQIPLVLQEKLHYELVNCLIWAGFWALMIITTITLIELFIRKMDFTERERQGAKWVGRLWAGGLSAVFGFFMMYCLDWALYIHMAPRVYILEWLKDMIK